MPLSNVSKWFLQSAFGDNAATVWVECGKFILDDKGNEQFRARWKGLARNASPLPDEAVFFSVGLISGDRRLLRNVSRVHVLVMDDVGTKHSREMIDLLAPAPSGVVESSSGNFQYMWFVPSGLTVAEHAGLWDGMEEAFGACDGRDAVHLFRLPQGVNGKISDSRKTGFRITGRKTDRVYAKDGLFPAVSRVTPGRSSTGPQQAPSVSAVADLLNGALANPWDGAEGSGLRGWWIAVLHAIKGALLEWPEEAEQLARAWSGEDEPDFDRVWDSIEPDRAGWGALEVMAKEAAARGMAAEAFDDGEVVVEDDGKIGMADFWHHAPSGKFIYTRTGDMWPAGSVDARVPGTLVPGSGGRMKMISGSAIIKATRQVQQLSWIPGEGKIVENIAINGGGIEVCPDNRIYNSYIGPSGKWDGGDPMKTLPWTAHARKIYPEDFEWILDWMAHRVQRPGEKVNHCLVLGGKQGIGKDTLLAPLVEAVGPWNFSEVRPMQLMERFNLYRKSVVLRVNEAHDLGEGQNRVKFYNNMKTLISAPPETLQVEQKGIDVYSIPNVCGVIITTNYKIDGLYLPADDRRHYVAWSNLTESDFGKKWFDNLWSWFRNGGYAHCVAFLRGRDISRFDPKAPPPKTRAFHSIANATVGIAGDEAEDVIESLGSPMCFSWDEFLNAAPGIMHDMAKTNPKLIAAKIDAAGYERVANPANKNGRWAVGKRMATVYAKRDMNIIDQQNAAQKWAWEKAKKEK